MPGWALPGLKFKANTGEIQAEKTANENSIFFIRWFVTINNRGDRCKYYGSARILKVGTFLKDGDNKVCLRGQFLVK